MNYPGILVKGPKKTTQTLSQGSRGWDLNSRPLEYEAGVIWNEIKDMCYAEVSRMGYNSYTKVLLEIVSEGEGYCTEVDKMGR
jgi:hypothetical protein